MKKITVLCLLVVLALHFSACGASPAEKGGEPQDTQQMSEQATLPSEETKETAHWEEPEGEATKPEEPKRNVLVAYFSCTGTTASLAQYAAELLDADLYEITPAEPYTEEDLAYYTNGRADQEQSDPDARPAIAGGVENMALYDTVLIGYPIWHGQAPRIIATFLESYDFTGKTILPFCTSHSSGIGSSDTDLHPLADAANWLTGRRFAAGTAKEAIAAWLEETEQEETEMKLKIQVGDTTFTATLAENSTVDAFKELLADGPLTLDMHDYAQMEKGADLGVTLPENNQSMNTQPGDIILYQGRTFVIYYDTNSWSLTPIGKIDQVDPQTLRDTLGDGDVMVTLSLG